MLKGSKHTPEALARIKAAKSGCAGHPRSPETRAKMRAARLANNPMKGHKHTEEALAKIRAANNRSHARGSEAVNWQGGRHVDRRGYVWIYMPDHPNAVGDYVAEHRLVMEHALGRYLGRDECVHHINHDPGDNRVENLMLLANGEHSRSHRLEEVSSLGSTAFAARFKSHQP